MKGRKRCGSEENFHSSRLMRLSFRQLYKKLLYIHRKDLPKLFSFNYKILMSQITYGRPRRSLPNVIQLPIESSHCHTLAYGIHLRLGLSVRFRLYPDRNSLIDLAEIHIIREILNTIVILRYNKVARDQ